MPSKSCKIFAGNFGTKLKFYVARWPNDIVSTEVFGTEIIENRTGNLMEGKPKTVQEKRGHRKCL